MRKKPYSMVQINMRGTKHETAKGPSSLFEVYCTCIANEKYIFGIFAVKTFLSFRKFDPFF